MTHARHTLCFLTLCVLLGGPVSAGPRWLPLGPYGGTVFSLTVAPSDARVLYASLYGILARSSDGGAHWTTVFDSGGTVAVDPARPGTVYLADGRLWKSVDAGKAWTEAGPRSGLSRFYISSVAVDPARASHVYAVGTEGVWRSTNRGASWRRTPLPAGSTVIAVRRPRPAVFVFDWASISLHESTDSGVSWRPVPLPGGTARVRSLAVAPGDARTLYAERDGGLFRSTDGGATWQATGRQPVAGDFVSVVVSPRSPKVLWLISELYGLYASGNGGDTWTAAGPQPGRRRVRAVALAPSAPRNVFVGLQEGGTNIGGVYASADNGKTWQQRNRGLTGLEATGFAVDPRDPTILWVSTREALFRSADAGASWTRNGPATGAHDIVIDPAVPSTVYASDGGVIWRTLDGGASWSSVRPPQPGKVLSAISFLRIGPENPAKLWVGYGGRLFSSADQGEHWNGVALPHATCHLSDLAFAPSEPSIFYLSGVQTACEDYPSLAAFFGSPDGGTTWKDTDADLLLHQIRDCGQLAIDPADPRVVYLATRSLYDDHGDGVWRSSDGGATWARAGDALKGQAVSALAVSSDGGNVWAGTYPGDLLSSSRIYHSGDGGDTWDERTAGLAVWEVSHLVIDPHDARRLYAAGSGGVWVLENEEP